jgi:hypothetical protein
MLLIDGVATVATARHATRLGESAVTGAAAECPAS